MAMYIYWCCALCCGCGCVAVVYRGFFVGGGFGCVAVAVACRRVDGGFGFGGGGGLFVALAVVCCNVGGGFGCVSVVYRGFFVGDGCGCVAVVVAVVCRSVFSSTVPVLRRW